MSGIAELIQRGARSARNRLSTSAHRVRGLRVQLLGVLGAASVGARPFVGRSVRLTIYGQLTIGDNVILDDGCHIYVGPAAQVVLGDRVRVGRNTVVAAANSIEIGNDVLIAEHCSIRDSDHQIDPDDRRHEKAAQTSPVCIGADCWLGAGVRVLRGAELGAGAIVGANAVVRGKIPARSVAVGAPARVVRQLA
jgi:acetyltransferase-like isoleucine patch superfamily enzyme